MGGRFKIALSQGVNFGLTFQGTSSRMRVWSAMKRPLKRRARNTKNNRKKLLEEPSAVERHFIEAVKEVKKLEKKKARTKRKVGKE